MPSNDRPAPNRRLAKGEKLAPLNERLARLGLVKDWDFVLHLPLRYEDLTRVTPFAELSEGVNALVEGTVTESIVRQAQWRVLTVILTSDEGDRMQLRFLHFYPSTQKRFAPGVRLRAYGSARMTQHGIWEMVHPKIFMGEAADQALEETLTPVYPTGENITQPVLRKRIARALLDVDLIDLMPQSLRRSLDVPDLAVALRNLHRPKPDADFAAYSNKTAPEWRRVKLDELLAQQITLEKARRDRRSLQAAPLLGRPDGLYARFLARLPFTLTNAQQRVLEDIRADLARSTPMHRLVQGDVGCGKTIVAALACLQAVDSGRQTALMAPTEILAEQHYNKLRDWLEPLGLRMLWLAGSLKPAEKAAAQQAVRTGAVDLVVGTHALIQEAVTFKNLGLAVVDEQHRFGVAQRLRLRECAQSGSYVHLLMLSATPIPRTLAMSYLADLDVSVIDELPAGRTPVVTKLVNLTRLEEVTAAVGNAVGQKKQCYWVCPLVEESEQLALTAATRRAETLARNLPECRIGLVHGAMSAADKAAVMHAFSAQKLDVLVATTVIEVGVDVPNASVMIIEHAERFGLSQLHQLRGRVGRGAVQSVCILLYDPQLTPQGRERLRVIKNNTDGFAIARADLALRGPGEFMGARQSGVPALRFSDLESDAQLIELAREAAKQWLAEDPDSADRHARRWYEAAPDYLGA